MKECDLPGLTTANIGNAKSMIVITALSNLMLLQGLMSKGKSYMTQDEIFTISNTSVDLLSSF